MDLISKGRSHRSVTRKYIDKKMRESRRSKSVLPGIYNSQNYRRYGGHGDKRVGQRGGEYKSIDFDGFDLAGKMGFRQGDGVRHLEVRERGKREMKSVRVQVEEERGERDYLEMYPPHKYPFMYPHLFPHLYEKKKKRGEKDGKKETKERQPPKAAKEEEVYEVSLLDGDVIRMKKNEFMAYQLAVNQMKLRKEKGKLRSNGSDLNSRTGRQFGTDRSPSVSKTFRSSQFTGYDRSEISENSRISPKRKKE